MCSRERWEGVIEVVAYVLPEKKLVKLKFLMLFLVELELGPTGEGKLSFLLLLLQAAATAVPWC